MKKSILLVLQAIVKQSYFTHPSKKQKTQIVKQKIILLASFFLFTISISSGQTLLYPENGSTIQGKNLFFKWDGGDLSANDKAYILVIKEVNNSQHPSNAIIENRPVYEQRIINNESIYVSLDKLETKENQSGNNNYVWQIITLNQEIKENPEISRSDFRTFTHEKMTTFSEWLHIDYSEVKENEKRTTAPPPPNDCLNSNVELGNFQGWAGYYGSRSNSNTVNLNSLTSGIINGRHTIRQISDGFDQLVGENIIPQVSEGNYSIRLGNSSVGSQADLIKYTFIVNQQNKNFSFKYALVLQDPNHLPGQQPFFSYYILKGSSILISPTNLPIAGQQLIANANSPFFKSKNGVIYREWTPTCIDLSNYVGETMTIVFLTADCSFTDHFGYAYIDALCESNEAVASFNMPSEICPNQDLIIDGSPSINETSYFWSIEESNSSGGRPNPSSEVYDWVVAQQAGSTINYSAAYLSKGKKFKCNTYYRIKLVVNNDCTSWSDQVKLLYVKCPSVNAGTDQCVSCTSTGNSIQLGQGNSNSSTLNYSWSPSNGLNNPTIASPSHQEGSTPYPVTYSVTVTDDSGCSNSDQITFYCKPSNVSLSQVKTCCGYTITANAQNYDYISWSTGQSGVTTINVTNGGTYTVTVSNNCGQLSKSIIIPSGTIFTGFFNVIAYNDEFFPPYGGNGLTNKLYIKDVMSGNGAANIPNSYNATEYKLEIYNRWGTLIRTTTGQSCNAFDNWSINWDGKDQTGSLVQQDVYTWRLYFKNCQYTSWWQPKERKFVDRVCTECVAGLGDGCGLFKKCKTWNVPFGTTEDVVITHGSVTVVR